MRDDFRAGGVRGGVRGGMCAPGGPRRAAPFMMYMLLGRPFDFTARGGAQTDPPALNPHAKAWGFCSACRSNTGRTSRAGVGRQASPVGTTVPSGGVTTPTWPTVRSTRRPGATHLSGSPPLPQPLGRGGGRVNNHPPDEGAGEGGQRTQYAIPHKDGRT